MVIISLTLCGVYWSIAVNMKEKKIWDEKSSSLKIQEINQKVINDNFHFPF